MSRALKIGLAIASAFVLTGTIDASNHLDFKMVATLTAPLGGGIGVATAR